MYVSQPKTRSVIGMGQWSAEVVLPPEWLKKQGLKQDPVLVVDDVVIVRPAQGRFKETTDRNTALLGGGGPVQLRARKKLPCLSIIPPKHFIANTLLLHDRPNLQPYCPSLPSHRQLTD